MGLSKWTQTPSITKPINFFTSFIHSPALGKKVKDAENIPIKINKKPIPKANKNIEKKPRIMLPFCATNAKSIANAGVRQGEATVPAKSPNKKLLKKGFLSFPVWFASDKKLNV